MTENDKNSIKPQVAAGQTDSLQLTNDRADSSHDNPWQQVDSRVVYENAWIRVSHDNVLTPAGTQGIYGTVHFKNHAVGVLVLDDEMHTYLVKQTRYVFGSATWEIPEGGCPKGEPLLEAAKRELLEETGLAAKAWKPWLSLDLSNSVTDEQATVFIAKDVKQGTATPELTEDIEVKRLPLHQAIAMVDSGEITDAISMAALLKAARVYGEQ